MSVFLGFDIHSIISSSSFEPSLKSIALYYNSLKLGETPKPYDSCYHSQLQKDDLLLVWMPSIKFKSTKKASKQPIQALLTTNDCSIQQHAHKLNEPHEVPLLYFLSF